MNANALFGDEFQGKTNMFVAILSIGRAKSKDGNYTNLFYGTARVKGGEHHFNMGLSQVDRLVQTIAKHRGVAEADYTLLNGAIIAGNLLGSENDENGNPQPGIFIIDGYKEKDASGNVIVTKREKPAIVLGGLLTYIADPKIALSAYTPLDPKMCERKTDELMEDRIAAKKPAAPTVAQPTQVTTPVTVGAEETA